MDKYKVENTQKRLFPHSECIMLIDTEQEKSINLGTRYKFPPLEEGQCFINEDQAMIMKVKKGDYIYHSIGMYQNLVALIDAYNRDVAMPARAQNISREIVSEGNDTSVIEFPC